MWDIDDSLFCSLLSECVSCAKQLDYHKHSLQWLRSCWLKGAAPLPVPESPHGSASDSTAFAASTVDLPAHLCGPQFAAELEGADAVKLPAHLGGAHFSPGLEGASAVDLPGPLGSAHFTPRSAQFTPGGAQFAPGTEAAGHGGYGGAADFAQDFGDDLGPDSSRASDGSHHSSGLSADCGSAFYLPDMAELLPGRGLSQHYAFRHAAPVRSCAASAAWAC